MPFATLPGVHLWYEDAGGEGPPVVFLHAASGTSESWLYQVPAFAAAGFRCISYDRRGRGRSQPAAGGEQPGCSSEDLHALVEYLGLARFHLVATAAGAVIALDYALVHPERLRSLVAACTIGGAQDAEYLAIQERIRPPEIQALPVHLLELGPSYRGRDADGTQHWLEIERASRPNGSSGPRQRQWNRLTLGLLETLRVPTLLLAGGADLISPPFLMRQLADCIPDATFAVLPEAGHAAFWEEPDAWNQQVLTFIGRH